MAQDSEKMRSVVEQALTRYELATDADNDERALAIDDMTFTYSEDGQWDDLAKERRRNKPRYTINQVAAAVNEVIGNYRQNQIEMKARPEQDASKDESDTYNGLIKAILSDNSAELAQHNAFKGMTVSGFGAVRVLNKYTEANPFEQDVCVEPVWDALTSVWFDPNAKDPTGKDGKYVFEVSYMTQEAFKETYPDATLSTWPDNQWSKLQKSWGLGDDANDVRIVDYYVKEPVKQTMVLLSDGGMITADAYEEVSDELLEAGTTMVDAKDVDTFKVFCYRMSACEVLEEPYEIPTKELPIVRGLGYYQWQNGVLHYRGIVRPAKDPQRVLNYTTSAAVEETALTPKKKVMATAKQIKGHENSWRSLNNNNSPVLPYTPDSEVPGGAPMPLDMSGPNVALVSQAQQAQLDLQSTIGRRAPAQGESAQDKSGRAILAMQKQDDAVTFELLDNLALMWEQVGQVVMDMIPAVYDTERQVLILNDDNDTEVVTINETITDEDTGEEYRKFDTSRRYRIKSSVGPAFETKRTEMVNVLSTLAQDDSMKPMVMDLLAKSMDFPFADELTKRIRKPLLQQGIVEPTDAEQEEMQRAMQSPEAQQAAQLQQQVQQMQLQGQMLLLEKTRLENANLEANIANLQAATMEKFNKGAESNANISETYVDVYTKQVDALIKQIEQGIAPSQEQLSTIQGSLQLLDATQQQEFTQRIQQALQQAQNIQPQFG